MGGSTGDRAPTGVPTVDSVTAAVGAIEDVALSLLELLGTVVVVVDTSLEDDQKAFQDAVNPGESLIRLEHCSDELSGNSCRRTCERSGPSPSNRFSDGVAFVNRSGDGGSTIDKSSSVSTATVREGGGSTISEAAC